MTIIYRRSLQRDLGLTSRLTSVTFLVHGLHYKNFTKKFIMIYFLKTDGGRDNNDKKISRGKNLELWAKLVMSSLPPPPPPSTSASSSPTPSQPSLSTPPPVLRRRVKKRPSRWGATLSERLLTGTTLADDDSYNAKAPPAAPKRERKSRWGNLESNGSSASAGTAERGLSSSSSSALVPLTENQIKLRQGKGVYVCVYISRCLQRQEGTGMHSTGESFFLSSYCF